MIQLRFSPVTRENKGSIEFMRAKFVILICFFLFGISLIPSAFSAPSPNPPKVIVLTLEGAIGAPAAAYLIRGIEQAEKQNANLAVIELNTPGGSGDAMLKIMSKIDNATVPVCVYVYPRGGMAASAGMYIAESAPLIAMAPQTTIGAAHPVSGGGGNIQGDERAKVTNTFASQAKTHAKRYGRNAKWVEEAVRKSVSVTEEEAVKLHVVDFKADNLNDLINKIDGKTVKVLDTERVLQTKNATVQEVPMTVVERFLLTITHPEIVLILFMLGFYGLLYELMSPGAILPGVVGAISLLLAFYAMGTLPVNYVGVFLIILSFIMFVLEFKFPSHGILTLGGTVSLVLGSLLLVASGQGYSRVYYGVVVVTVLFTLGFVFLILGKLWQVRRAKQIVGKESLAGQLGMVKSPLTPEGYVFLDGVLWHAVSDEGVIPAGEKVLVTRMEKLLLHVRRA